MVSSVAFSKLEINHGNNVIMSEIKWALCSAGDELEALFVAKQLENVVAVPNGKSGEVA